MYVYGTNVLIYNAVYGYSHVDYHRFTAEIGVAII